MNHRNRNRVIAGLALGLAVGTGTYLGAGPGQDAPPTSPRQSVAARASAIGADDVVAPGRSMRIDLPPEQAPSKLDDGLRAIAAHTPASLAEALKGPNSLPEFVASADGKDIMVELVGFDAERTRRAVAALAAQGLRDVVSDGRLAAGWMPIETLSALEANADVQMARALPKIIASLGQVENQGHVAMISDEVRRRYEIDGAGIKIGILSTSFNLSGGQQAGINGGDLPGPGNPNGYTQPVRIVVEGVPGLFPSTSLDEGRAMAEIVHDIAPGAEILFAGPAGASSVHYANAMEALAQAGADIIVDDIGLGPFLVPFYQDDLAARKVNELEARGIRYFTAAGNYKDRSMYEATWSSRADINANDFDTFDFNPDPNVYAQSLDIVPVAGATTFSAVITTQWDQPWPAYSAPGVGAANQLRIALLNEKGGLIGSSLSVLGGNPQFLSTLNNRPAVNADNQPAAVKLVLLKPKDGRPNPGRIKIHLRLTNAVVAPSVNMLPAATGWGHQNARGAIVVGASSWFNTPQGAPVWNSQFANLLQTNGTPVGTTPVPLSPILGYLGGPSVLIKGSTGESLITGSVVGQPPILFDNAGNRLTQPELRQNPWIVAPDAIQTSFFGVTPSNLQTRPFFFGTSAAAPNAAAVGALLLQVSRKSLNPAQLKALLATHARDMDNPFANGQQTNPADPLFSRGYDTASGHGLIQALPAVEQIIAPLSIQNLDLNWQCSTATGNRWRVGNPNSFGVRVTLTGTGGIRLPRETAFGTSLRENLVVPPGGLNFETPFGLYSTTSTLAWTNKSGTPFFLNKTKVGSWTTCQ